MYVDTVHAVTRRIEELCRQRSLNIHSLARRSGVPPTTVKNIMYGNSKNPGIVTIKLLCDGLGISLYEFFDSDLFKNLEVEDIQ